MAVGGGGIAIESVGDAAAPMIGGAGIFSADAVGAMGVPQVNRIGTGITQGGVPVPPKVAIAMSIANPIAEHNKGLNQTKTHGAVKVSMSIAERGKVSMQMLGEDARDKPAPYMYESNAT